jgi:hypothetical protein
MIGSLLLRAMTLATILISMSACGFMDFLEGQSTVDPAITVGTRMPTRVGVPGRFTTFDLDRDCMPIHQKSNTSTECIGPTMKLIYDQPNTPEQRALLRNQFQDYLLWRSEQLCESHKAGIVSTQSGANFTLNSLTTILTAVATVATGNLTKSILAASGGGTNAIRSHFNEDFYQRVVAPVVVRKINELRAAELQQLMSKRGQRPVNRSNLDKQSPVEAAVEAKKVADAKKPTVANPDPDKLPPTATTPIDAYTVEEAVVDVERYHQRCSFIAGMSEVVEPTLKFADTVAGIRQRMADLRAEIESNITLRGKVTNEEQRKRLDLANQDLAAQIQIMSNRLAIAPTNVNTPGTKPGS